MYVYISIKLKLKVVIASEVVTRNEIKIHIIFPENVDKLYMVQC